MVWPEGDRDRFLSAPPAADRRNLVSVPNPAHHLGSHLPWATPRSALARALARLRGAALVGASMALIPSATEAVPLATGQAGAAFSPPILVAKHRSSSVSLA